MLSLLRSVIRTNLICEGANLSMELYRGSVGRRNCAEGARCASSLAHTVMPRALSLTASHRHVLLILVPL